MKQLEGMNFAYMKTKDVQLVYHINVHYQELIEEFKIVKDFEDFTTNKIIKKAFILYLIQIGENVNKLSVEFQNNLNKINLKGIIGFRNYLVHGYRTIDDKIVWNTITEYLPKFIKKINDIKLNNIVKYSSFSMVWIL